jgi:hypothetical protein
MVSTFNHGMLAKRKKVRRIEGWRDPVETSSAIAWKQRQWWTEPARAGRRRAADLQTKSALRLLYDYAQSFNLSVRTKNFAAATRTAGPYPRRRQQKSLMAGRPSDPLQRIRKFREKPTTGKLLTGATRSPQLSFFTLRFTQRI